MTKDQYELLSQIESMLGIRCESKEDDDITKFIDAHYDELLAAYISSYDDLKDD